MAREKSVKRAKKQIKSRKKRYFFGYPLIIFLFLCAGAFLLAATLNVGADDIFVTAKVAGPPVTAPAEITSPSDGAHFTAIPITVAGTCSANTAYVEIFRNNLMSGSVICSSTRSFEIPIDLFTGQNTLTAHSFNMTDDEGPVSAPITVFYDAPQPTSSSDQPANQPLPVSNPLILKTAFVYKGYYVGQSVVWPLQISGGTAPYAVNVAWGDGTNDVISRGAEGKFNLTHKYSSPGAYKGSYVINVKASDSKDQKAFLQFFVVVNSRQVASPGTVIFTKSPPTLDTKSWLWVAWPAYGLVTLMGISYLLGEKEELIKLGAKGLLKR